MLTILICIAVGICAYLPLLIWRFFQKKKTGPTFLHYSVVMFCLTFSFGVIGLFFGISIFKSLVPESPQGPLAGIFTGVPLGILAGLIGSWIWFYIKRLKINR